MRYSALVSSSRCSFHRPQASLLCLGGGDFGVVRGGALGVAAPAGNIGTFVVSTGAPTPLWSLLVFLFHDSQQPGDPIATFSLGLYLWSVVDLSLPAFFPSLGPPGAFSLPFSFFIFFQLVVLRQNVLLFLIGLLFPGVVLVPRLMQLRGDALLPDN